MREVIEKFQCVGCVSGEYEECFSESSSHRGCRNHTSGTSVLGVGKVFLGMPVGFNHISRGDFELREELPKEDWLNIMIKSSYDKDLDRTTSIFIHPRISSIGTWVSEGDVSKECKNNDVEMGYRESKTEVEIFDSLPDLSDRLTIWHRMEDGDLFIRSYCCRTNTHFVSVVNNYDGDMDAVPGITMTEDLLATID